MSNHWYLLCINDIISTDIISQKGVIYMWDRKELKALGKDSFKANYWRSVLCALILAILSTGTSLSTSTQTQSDSGSDPTAAAVAGIILILCICFALKIFIFNPLQIGCYGFFRDNVKIGGVDLGILKTGFQNYGHTFVTLLLRDVFLMLWTCLFIVPGCIKYYSYRMVPFILRENPGLSATEVINASRRMMDGHKWNTFVLDLSFIGWYLLSAITFGLVGVFWAGPYRENTIAALYLELSGQSALPSKPSFDSLSEPLSK